MQWPGRKSKHPFKKHYYYIYIYIWGIRQTRSAKVTYNQYICQKKNKQYVAVCTVPVRMFREHTIARLTHSPHATKIVRIRCYTVLSTICKCKDVNHTISVSNKCLLKNNIHHLFIYNYLYSFSIIRICLSFIRMKSHKTPAVPLRTTSGTCTTG